MGRMGTSLRLAAILALTLGAAARAQTADAPAQPPDAAPPAPAAPAAPAPAPTAPAGDSCTRAEFEAVVDDAAAALRDLNLKNKPDFQEKLRQLKDKRGWSHDQFMTEAAPYVRDDKIAVFDQESDQLLNDISSLGQEGADAKTPDCALLHELRARMKVLVDTQSAKWRYMFEKLNAALAQ
jgi:hypothetical protein